MDAGSTRSASPILTRAINFEIDLYDALKTQALVFINSTMRSNLSVGMPIDFFVVQRDRCDAGIDLSMDANPAPPTCAHTGTWRCTLHHIHTPRPPSAAALKASRKANTARPKTSIRRRAGFEFCTAVTNLPGAGATASAGSSVGPNCKTIPNCDAMVSAGRYCREMRGVLPSAQSELAGERRGSRWDQARVSLVMPIGALAVAIICIVVAVLVLDATRRRSYLRRRQRLDPAGDHGSRHRCTSSITVAAIQRHYAEGFADGCSSRIGRSVGVEADSHHFDGVVVAIVGADDR